jgi:hypothetical protein
MSDTGAYQAAFEQVQRLVNAREFDLALEQVDAILEVHALSCADSRRAHTKWRSYTRNWVMPCTPSAELMTP